MRRTRSVPATAATVARRIAATSETTAPITESFAFRRLFDRRFAYPGTWKRVVDIPNEKQDEIRIVDVIVAADEITGRGGHDERSVCVHLGRSRLQLDLLAL